VLLSRCLCGEFCSEILPLHGFEDYSRVRCCTTYHIAATISIQTTSSSSLVASHFQVNHRPYPSIIQGMLGLRYRIRRDRCCLGLYWRSKAVWISVQGGELNTQSFCQPRHVCEEFSLIRGAAVATDQSVRKWFTPSESHLVYLQASGLLQHGRRCKVQPRNVLYSNQATEERRCLPGQEDPNSGSSRKGRDGGGRSRDNSGENKKQRVVPSTDDLADSLRLTAYGCYVVS
jgi:hypothetical protein